MGLQATIACQHCNKDIGTVNIENLSDPVQIKKISPILGEPLRFLEKKGKTICPKCDKADPFFVGWARAKVPVAISDDKRKFKCPNK